MMILNHDADQFALQSVQRPNFYRQCHASQALVAAPLRPEIDLHLLVGRLQCVASRLHPPTSELQRRTSCLQPRTSRLQCRTSGLQLHVSRLHRSASGLHGHVSHLQDATNVILWFAKRLQAFATQMRSAFLPISSVCKSLTSRCKRVAA